MLQAPELEKIFVGINKISKIQAFRKSLESTKNLKMLEIGDNPILGDIY